MESNVYYEVNENESLLQRSRSPVPESCVTTTLRPLAAECVGTAFFVALATMAAILKPNDPLAVAAVHGFVIFIVVSIFADTSGGHFNPAVTLAVVLVGEIRATLAIGYVMAQLVGAVLGSACCMMILSSDVVGIRNGNLFSVRGGGITAVAERVGDRQAISCEVLLTCLLVLTVLMCAVDQCSSMAPYCIGMTVFVDILAGGQISGASMNPARSFGPSMVMTFLGHGHWSGHYVYWVGPALGSVLATLFYKIIGASGDKRVFKN